MKPTDSIIIGGYDLQTSALKVTNYRAAGVHQFKRRRRKEPITEFVIHESVTRNAATTVKILKKQRHKMTKQEDGTLKKGKPYKLGIHFIVTETGAIVQHADLLTKQNHGGPHSERSIGVEVTNPFEPRHLKKRSPWKRVINAPWAVGGEYVVPLPEQAEATAQLVAFFSGRAFDIVDARDFNIPRTWRGRYETVDERPRAMIAMGRIPQGKRPGPGIWAHTYFGHSDGSWLVLYSWLRIVAGLDPAHAYTWAMSLAEGAKDVVDLSPVLSWVNRPPPPGLTEHD